MHEDDVNDRGLEETDLVDITRYSRDDTTRDVPGYRVACYEGPLRYAVGYMAELNVLCGIADFSTESEQPITKHLLVEVASSR
jgi:hypothetical protein